LKKERKLAILGETDSDVLESNEGSLGGVGESEESISDRDDDDDSGGNSDDEGLQGEDGWIEKKESDCKYRKQLPARDNPEARLAEKDSRKETRKGAKELAAKKRQEKVPKHVKKRAIKAGKKK
jgi:hypothetical protein